MIDAPGDFSMDDPVFRKLDIHGESSNNILAISPYLEQRASILPYLSLLSLLVIGFSLLAVISHANPQTPENILKNIPLLGATVLKIKVQANELPPEATILPVELPGPDQSRVEPADFSSSPFVTGMSLRAARGRFGSPGPGAIWYRVDRPIVLGSPVSQAMRAMVAADFCNGTSAVLDFHQWTFLNADLTVNFSRQPEGEWMLLDAESWIGPDGAGLAMARLADERGYFGRAIQSLVIEKR